MLLWLAHYFKQDLGVLRVFQFITFRAVFATLTALAIGLFAGPAVIGQPAGRPCGGDRRAGLGRRGDQL